MEYLQSFCVVPMLMLVFAGCGAPDQSSTPRLGESGTGGAPTTITAEGGGGGALFDPGVTENVPCCVDLAPFQGVAVVTDIDTPCPAGTEEGDTWYADFLKPAPHTCECSCSEPSCTLPDGTHTNAAKCPGDGSPALAFGPGSGWDGACSSQDPVPAGIQCSGVPCVQSVTVPALLVVPCEPSAPVVSKTDAFWGRTARACAVDVPMSGCGGGQICVPAPPGGFDICLHGEGDLECPSGFAKSLFYTEVEDDRGCEECECGPPDAQCEAYVVAYSSPACGVPAGSVIATTDEPACFDVPSGIALGSVEASFLAESAGSCAAGGGAPTGDVVPGGPVTLCCRGALEAPG